MGNKTVVHSRHWLGERLTCQPERACKGQLNDRLDLIFGQAFIDKHGYYGPQCYVININFTGYLRLGRTICCYFLKAPK